MCATDAGREGELIFRYVYEKTGCRKPVNRLWLSSLTPEAIRQGLGHLRDGADFDPLADAARGRSRADWLFGMNLSRATTLAHDETLHVGRVQTPTLALLVEREQAIRSFVPEDYLEVVATFDASTGPLRRDVVPPALGHARGRGAWPRTGPRRGRSSRARRARRPRWSRPAPRRGGCRRRCSTTSPTCSATPTASTA